jgi:hypothetical protein
MLWEILSGGNSICKIWAKLIETAMILHNVVSYVLDNWQEFAYLVFLYYQPYLRPNFREGLV